jgi:hypothetical protein
MSFSGGGVISSYWAQRLYSYNIVPNGMLPRSGANGRLFSNLSNDR